jgi:hypothetical protein
MNRFFDIAGDVSTQLAPWNLDNPAKAIFKLEVPLRFRSDIAGGVIIVPAGYRSDLASIPQFAWSIFMASDDPRIELGGWIHDLLYQHTGVVKLQDGSITKLQRWQCDRILAFEAMVDLQATPLQRWLVYQSLRRLGDPWKGDSIFERLQG